MAATHTNAIQEQRDYASLMGFTAPPMGLNVYITSWGIMAGLASTPMFGKRFVSDLPGSFINTYLISLIPPVTPLRFLAVLTRVRLDMAIDYHTEDAYKFSSERIKETIYHELCHASQYSQLGNSWYTSFVSAELSEIAKQPSASDQYNPYGWDK